MFQGFWEAYRGKRREGGKGTFSQADFILTESRAVKEEAMC